ncbi:hypothetical protein [Cellulosimicrobium sp. Marseille-Q4280]|uniref:hypothetical protein n=1 Tax=Cellulosimicrobium sp. Marseille-Q4280 TaxID=2937992 RepID=UPI00203FC233|nr:hypothetical protein [Cellulosimicrobium sp. Marseille-Q4280]
MMAPAPSRVVHWTRDCPTGKRGYMDKGDAKKVASAMRREGTKVRAYPCDQCSEFHVGHMPKAVRDGEVSASQFYAQKAEATAPV